MGQVRQNTVIQDSPKKPDHWTQSPFFYFPPEGEAESWGFSPEHTLLCWARGMAKMDKCHQFHYPLQCISYWLCTHLGCCNLLTAFWSSPKAIWSIFCFSVKVSVGEWRPGASWSTVLLISFPWVHSCFISVLEKCSASEVAHEKSAFVFFFPLLVWCQFFL